MNIFNEIHELTAKNIPFTFCVVIDTEGSTPRKAGSKMLVLIDGAILGTIGGGSIEKQVTDDALVLLNSGGTLTKKYCLAQDLQMHCGGKMTIFMEAVSPDEQLVIFGAGHIGKSLATMAKTAGFRVNVIDDRPEIFNDWQQGIAHTILSPYKEAIDKFSFHKNTYIVICTYMHSSDTEIAAMCINKQYKYIGMIGSSRKVAQARKKFADEFKISEEKINGIDMPIGISIKCETPADIAISILAKLIDVKNSDNK